MEYHRTQIIVKDQYGREVLCDSYQEASYYQILLERLKKGEIADLQCHPEFVLQPPFIYEGKKVNGIVYTPDFTYIENGKVVAIEVKGIPTPDFELRVKLFKYKYNNIHLIIMCYSKSTGWREMSEYKKVRKQLVKEQLEARLLRQQKEQEEKAKRLRDKELARIDELMQKPKLTKTERERLYTLKSKYNLL